MSSTSLATYELYATLPAQIAVRIGHAIVEGEFQPGRKLQEVELAGMFGVSRASVREALRMVEREGLVTILPQRGAQVTALSIEEVQDVFEIRAHLMALAYRRLAAGATPAVREKLGEMLVRLRELRSDGTAYARASQEISAFSVQNAGSKRLAELILSFGRQTARYTRLSLSTPSRRQKSYASWQKLVRATIEGRAGEAEKLARQLALATRDTALTMLRDATNGGASASTAKLSKGG